MSKPNTGDSTAVSIVDFGAVGDGSTVNTAAINRAIEHACHMHAEKVVVRDQSDQMQSSNASPDARLARAVIVAKGVRDLIIDGITVSYPDGPVGEDYVPKVEHRELVRDPRTHFEPMPDFHVFWARDVRGGVVRLCGARPFGNASQHDIDDCCLTVTD
ncbi:MAG: hypothetical protein GF331_27145 [Chitinivibrionales bacterium]|nr:hypothetical protein [Chitinivibrionales bacterium]